MFHDISLIVTNISPISSQWHETYGKPVMVTEYGGDTVAGLHSLPSLSLLDISHNSLAALPPTLFHQSVALQKLYLQNNSLSLLSSEIFSGLDNLLLLNISYNDISSPLLSETIFSGLQKLVALDLGHNSLTKLRSGLLSNQNNLQILNLQHNNLANIEAGSLGSLINLHILLLSHNQLGELPRAVLGSLGSLSSLSLDHNRLTLLPPGLFQGTPMLQDLALNNNYLDTIPSDIAGLSKLRTLDLGENRITEVASQQLENLASLYGLRLAGRKYYANKSQNKQPSRFPGALKSPVVFEIFDDVD